MRRKRRRRLIRLLILLALLLAVLTAVFLFRVKKTIVSGNSHHTSDEITSGLMTDFWSENTLFLLWKYRDGSIPDTLPFLDSMKIKMKSPTSISVTVTEKQPVGYVDTGEYVYFDANGLVIDVSEEIYGDVPVITGATLGDVTLYKKLPTQSSTQLRTILSLLELLDYQGLAAKEIRFAEDGEITVYIGNIEAILGQDEYLEEKVANLKAVLDTMDERESGTLHVENVTGKNESITFSSSGLVEDETEDETENLTEADTQTQETDASGGDGSDASSDTGSSEASDDGTEVLGGAGADGSSSESDSSETSSSETSSSETTSSDTSSSETDESEDSGTSGADLMVFNSSGQLVYNVHVQNGVVVDAYGNEVPGCSVDENGNVVDAYMNVIDPNTGELLN